ncbi:MAG: hypothetical protein RLY31_723 [Bacteroidota bacterium]|jgi:hypothetical protein
MHDAVGRSLPRPTSLREPPAFGRPFGLRTIIYPLNRGASAIRPVFATRIFPAEARHATGRHHHLCEESRIFPNRFAVWCSGANFSVQMSPDGYGMPDGCPDRQNVRGYKATFERQVARTRKPFGIRVPFLDPMAGAYRPGQTLAPVWLSLATTTCLPEGRAMYPAHLTYNPNESSCDDVSQI